MLRKIAVNVCVLAGSMALQILPLTAGTSGPYNISRIDAPAASLTVACGVDMRGGVVGYFVDRSGTHGFLLNDGAFSIITFPGAAWTAAYGINTAGQIIGAYGANETGGRHGFLRSGSRFSSIDFPDSRDTVARGINNKGQIVGDYLGPDGSRHGFLLSGGNYRNVELPGVDAIVGGINDAGQIVGMLGSGTTAKGFLISAESYSPVQFPNTSYTEVSGVNDLGDIVGKIDGPQAPFRGFLRSGNDYGIIDVTGFPSSWDGRGINDLGEIVGSFTDNDGKTHGYMATPVALEAAPADPAGIPVVVLPDTRGVSGPIGPLGTARPQAVPNPSVPAVVSKSVPLRVVHDAISKAADNLLKAANQSDYVQKAIIVLDMAVDDTNGAIAYNNSHPNADPLIPQVTRPNFAAAPPPAPQRNFELYAALNSLKYAFDELARTPGGKIDGFRTRINSEIASAATILINGISSYNARHPGPR